MVKSYAKINLALNVLNKTKPDSYHELDMLNVSISLFDTLLFKVSEKNDDIIITCNNPNIPVDERNLIYKVIIKFKKVLNKHFSITVKLTKNIPSEAGLGGGSSNAAATLNYLDNHFKTNMSLTQKINFIKDITADGPYMLVNKTSRVKGKGEIISPIDAKLKYKVAIVKPSFGFSTKEIFSNLDYKNLVHPNMNKIEDAIKNNDFSYLSSHVENSLYNACKTINPNIEIIKNKLKECGFELVSLSGSGSAIFAISSKKEAYKNFKKSFNKADYELIGIYNIIR